MISRIGETELRCINFYERHRKNKKIRINYYYNLKKTMSNNAGFFPTNDKYLDDFSKLYLDSLENVDVIGVWHNPNENKIIEKFSRKAELVPLRALEPYYFENPWSMGLLNKKVLVIHPFEESIRKQYNKREKLFKNKEILPKFELLTIKAIQTIANNNLDYENWFQALEYMKREIDKKEFDIAIIGAGAYGLPLASYIKSIGKKAIHIGGATQILFGIKGKRWDGHEIISKLFNEHWERPSENEKIKNNNKVEDGCYW